MNGVVSPATAGLTADNRLREPLEAVLSRAPPSWRPLIERWQGSADGQRLLDHLRCRQAQHAVIYPSAVLHALALTPRDCVRAVILGQDPYHGAGQAVGLAFAVPRDVRPPPSLRNILAELARDLRTPQRADGDLAAWARQGVLMLNAVLTVEEGAPNAHARYGWEALTDILVSAVAGDADPKVFMLWGAQAQAKASLVEAAGGGRHLVLRANHPSPLSARRPPLPFFGCGHFGLASEFLARQDPAAPPIDWST